jgi:hypothetical protein
MEFIIGVVVGAVGWWAWSKWGHMLTSLNKK